MRTKLLITILLFVVVGTVDAQYIRKVNEPIPACDADQIGAINVDIGTFANRFDDLNKLIGTARDNSDVIKTTRAAYDFQAWFYDASNRWPDCALAWESKRIYGRSIDETIILLLTFVADFDSFDQRNVIMRTAINEVSDFSEAIKEAAENIN